jgi:hypothetical protein
VPVLKRAKEKLDRLQRRTRDAYDKLIIEALRQSFSSNITDLTKKANELKEQSPSRDLPAGKLQRKIVSLHLKRLVKEKKVLVSSREYVLLESLAGPSYRLHKKVRSLLHDNQFAELDFRFVENVAGSYMITRPETSKEHQVVSGLWEQEAVRFLRGLFGLDALITYAVKQGHIPSNIRSRSGIDMAALREGLKRSLGNLELFILSFAVDIPELLSYISTPVGERFARHILDREWDTIMEQAKSRFRYDPALIVNKDTIELDEIWSRAKKRVRDMK